MALHCDNSASVSLTIQLQFAIECLRRSNQRRVYRYAFILQHENSTQNIMLRTACITLTAARNKNVSIKYWHQLRVGQFWQKFGEEGVYWRKPINAIWERHRTVVRPTKKSCRCLLPFEHNARTWQTDKQTDRQQNDNIDRNRRNRLSAMWPKSKTWICMAVIDQRVYTGCIGCRQNEQNASSVSWVKGYCIVNRWHQWYWYADGLSQKAGLQCSSWRATACRKS